MSSDDSGVSDRFQNLSLDAGTKSSSEEGKQPPAKSSDGGATRRSPNITVQTTGGKPVSDDNLADDNLLESPVPVVLRAILTKWKSNSRGNYIADTLLPRVDGYIEEIISDRRLQSHSKKPKKLLNAFNGYLRRINPPGMPKISKTKGRHYAQIDVAAMLGLIDSSSSPTSPVNFVNTNLRHTPNVKRHTGQDISVVGPSAGGASNDASSAKPSTGRGKTADDPGAGEGGEGDDDPYWAVDHVRSLMAHCLSYEHHIKPHLDKLREKCEALRNKGTNRTHLVSLYARHVAALHSVLQVHRAAVDHIGQDLVHFMISEPESNEKMLPWDIYRMSRELRDQVPSLRMPNDAYAAVALGLRRRYPHLSELYLTVHGALCQLAFQSSVDGIGSVLIPEGLDDVLRILGGDKKIAGHADHSNFSAWAEHLRNEYSHRPEEFLDDKLVSQIVSILQEVCKMFPRVSQNCADILEKLVTKIRDDIEIVVPKKAQEGLSELRYGINFLWDSDVQIIAGALLRSPSPLAQIDGLRAIALYVRPFAKRHYQTHLEREKRIEDDQTRRQQACLGEAFQHYLRPYDRQDAGEGEKGFRNLSLFHLGPLPPNKGRDVQVQVGRGAVHAGSVGSMNPLVVVVGPSGVGKSDLLEQTSKYRTEDDGSLSTNTAHIMLPLNFRHVMDSVTRSSDMRDDLEREIMVQILAYLIVAITLLDCDGQNEHTKEDLSSSEPNKHNEGALPPTPHDLFRYFNNGGGAFVTEVRAALRINIDSSTVTLSRRLLLEAAEKAAQRRARDDQQPHASDDQQPHASDDQQPHASDDQQPHASDDQQPHASDGQTHAPDGQIRAGLSFAVDEINVLSEMFKNKVRKSDEAEGGKSGSMLTVVANTLQMFGTSVYAGTGLRYSLFEETISALGKEIIVMAPSFPPTAYRTVVYMLHRLLRFESLKRGKGTTAMQSIEVSMLCGRMRFVELFMIDLLKKGTGDNVPFEDRSALSEQDHPEHTFCVAMVEAAKLITNGVRGMMQRLIGNDDALRCALELATSGVMRVDATPGDPQNADNVLVRCGLVQLDDNEAYISDATEGANSYLFLNREPMIQHALSEAVFNSVGNAEHFAKLEEHIWKEHVVVKDFVRNGVETLGWLLLRAMSKDCALHNLLTGASDDSELAEYANETTFVWCDPPGGFPKSYPPWIEEYEKEHNVDFPRFLWDKYRVAQKHLEGCVEDLWFHVAHLDHSDPTRVRFLSRVAVLPPQPIGADIISSWRHKTDPERSPLLVLVACTERHDDDKLRADARNTFPDTMGSRFNDEEQKMNMTDFSVLSGPLQNRCAMRILLHPNVIPGQNVDIAKLAKLYDLSEEFVRQGHGRDSNGNFVSLINRTTLQRAIKERGGKCGSFGDMVLRLWERYFERQSESASMKEHAATQIPPFDVIEAKNPDVKDFHEFDSEDDAQSFFLKEAITQLQRGMAVGLKHHSASSLFENDESNGQFYNLAVDKRMGQHQALSISLSLTQSQTECTAIFALDGEKPTFKMLYSWEPETKPGPFWFFYRLPHEGGKFKVQYMDCGPLKSNIRAGPDGTTRRDHNSTSLI